MVKRPLVVLYLVYIYIKFLTSLVNITLSQSVRAVWRVVHSTVRLLLLLLSAGRAVRAWDRSVPSTPSVGPRRHWPPRIIEKDINPRGTWG